VQKNEDEKCFAGRKQLLQPNKQNMIKTADKTFNYSQQFYAAAHAKVTA